MSNNYYGKTQTKVSDRGAVIWIQCVASKSGGDAHTVRAFEGGLITCTCDGFNWRGQCSHMAIGKAQEAREALAAANLPVAAPVAPQAPAITAKAARAAAAMSDLFGADWQAL